MRIPHTRGDEPTRKGQQKRDIDRIPHTRGDEPRAGSRATARWFVFPTRVGMNRSEAIVERFAESIPHTRGDEPFC